jgi:hypothetical protein
VAILSKFFGRAGSDAVGVAIGSTAAPALLPIAQLLINEAWEKYPDRPLPLALAAQVAAEDRTMEDFLREQGRMQGFSEEKSNTLIHALRGGPDVLLGLDLWRRGFLDDAGMDRVLWEARLEEAFHAPVKRLKHVLLSPADLAVARQRGFVDAARQIAESIEQGLSAEDATVLFESAGLPPPTERAMEMWRRSIITEAEFRQTIVEGNEKLKYQAEEAALFWQLAPAATLVNLRLRGWIADAEYHNRMREHGFQPAIADDLFHALGRPATVLQAVRGFRRGGRYQGQAADERALVGLSVRQSDIRPEWEDVLAAQRESFPSAFVLRRLVEDGAFTAAEAADILYQNAWRRDIADAAAASWAADLGVEYEGHFYTRAQYVAGMRELGYDDATANGKADAIEAKKGRTSRNQLVARVHSQYVNHRISRDAAVAALTRADVPARVRNAVMPDWDLEREITADALTSAQIKKAYVRGIFTRATAVARLEFKGYDAADANIYLDE